VAPANHTTMPLPGDKVNRCVGRPQCRWSRGRLLDAQQPQPPWIGPHARSRHANHTSTHAGHAGCSPDDQQQLNTTPVSTMQKQVQAQASRLSALHPTKPRGLQHGRRRERAAQQQLACTAHTLLCSHVFHPSWRLQQPLHLCAGTYSPFNTTAGKMAADSSRSCGCLADFMFAKPGEAGAAAG
jgi:hypothetical protein